MERYSVPLTDAEFEELERLYPRHKGPGATEERAIQIVMIHFQRRDPRCTFERPKRGADLVITPSTSGVALAIEVKGTASSGIAPERIKVSSSRSRQLLVEDGMPLFRVSDVFGRSPEIRVMLHGEHFELYVEGRWAVRMLNRSADVTATKKASPARIDRSALKIVAAARSKYRALRVWLEKQQGTDILLSLQEAEAELGFALPISAHRYQAFWANQSNLRNRPWAKAWYEAGFRVDRVNLSPTGGWVRFKRVSRPAAPKSR